MARSGRPRRLKYEAKQAHTMPRRHATQAKFMRISKPPTPRRHPTQVKVARISKPPKHRSACTGGQSPAHQARKRAQFYVILGMQSESVWRQRHYTQGGLGGTKFLHSTVASDHASLQMTHCHARDDDVTHTQTCYKLTKQAGSGLGHTLAVKKTYCMVLTKDNKSSK